MQTLRKTVKAGARNFQHQTALAEVEAGMRGMPQRRTPPSISMRWKTTRDSRAGGDAGKGVQGRQARVGAGAGVRVVARCAVACPRYTQRAGGKKFGFKR